MKDRKYLGLQTHTHAAVRGASHPLLVAGACAVLALLLPLDGFAAGAAPKEGVALSLIALLAAAGGLPALVTRLVPSREYELECVPVETERFSARARLPRRVDPDTLRSLSFELENRGPGVILVEWDACAFVDPDGRSARVVHGGVLPIQRALPQVRSAVAPASVLVGEVTPAESIYWRIHGPVGWRTEPLLRPWAEADALEFRLELALSMDGRLEHHALAFRVTRPSRRSRAARLG